MARRSGHYAKKPTTNRSCPFCDDCFKCPLSDCKVGSVVASTYNILPGDMERTKKNKGKGGPGNKKEGYNKESRVSPALPFTQYP